MRRILTHKESPVDPPSDSCGRRISYLRLSITDRCNLRCHYCMPEEGVPKLGHADILSFEELERLAEAVTGLGIEKIRITGGEPLVRKGVVGFLARIGQLPHLRHLVLTTNGVLLPELAPGLAHAGVHSLNISLDSLDAGTFACISKRPELKRVLAGIEAALAAKIQVKLNMVPMRGINDGEILRMVDFARERRISIRFIEYMPVYRPADWQARVISGEEVLTLLRDRFDLIPLPRSPLAGPAQNFRISGQETTIGLISPVYGHTCGDCNRIRVTATGRARGCLFSDGEVDLRPLLREGREEALEQAIRQVIGSKPDGHHLHDPDAGHSAFPMSRIGG